MKYLVGFLIIYLFLVAFKIADAPWSYLAGALAGALLSIVIFRPDLIFKK